MHTRMSPAVDLTWRKQIYLIDAMCVVVNENAVEDRNEVPWYRFLWDECRFVTACREIEQILI